MADFENLDEPSTSQLDLANEAEEEEEDLEEEYQEQELGNQNLNNFELEEEEEENTFNYQYDGYEMPGEGYYYGEMPGEGYQYGQGGYGAGQGQYAEEEPEEEAVEEEEDPETGSFLELINEAEEEVDPETAFEAIKTLQATLKEAQYPKMKIVRTLLHTIACGLARGGPVVRAQALELGAYETVMSAWALWCHSSVTKVKILTDRASAIRHFAMRAMVCITPGFSDIFDDLGAEMVMQGLASNVPLRTQLEALRVLRNVCIKSEKNRERFSDSPGFFDSLCHLIKRSEGEELEQVVREWCGTVKTLMLNDDPRVTYNQAPERKRMIYQQRILPSVAHFLSKDNWENSTLNAIMVLLGTFACNEDYCLHIDLGGVLTSIHRIITTPQCINSQMLMKNSLSLLRYMVCSEEIRAKSASMGLVRHVLKVMQVYRMNSDVLEVAMSCCSFLTMKNACQTALFISLGAVHMFIDIMQKNVENIYLLKGGILTLRCVAVNGLNNGKKTILGAGGELLLQDILARFPELKQNYVNPTLIELGLEIAAEPEGKEPIIEIFKAPSPPKLDDDLET